MCSMYALRLFFASIRLFYAYVLRLPVCFMSVRCVYTVGVCVYVYVHSVCRHVM
jgi:hypothetical protein